jgi:excisionase family DNA binding protein
VESAGTKGDETSAVSVGRKQASSIALEELMTAGQVAALLMLPVSTVKDYARRGVLPSIKLGKHRRFVRSQMEATIVRLAGRQG